MITFKLVFKIVHPWIRWVPAMKIENKRRIKKRYLKMHRKASGQSNYTDGKRAHPIWHHLIARTILSYLRRSKSRTWMWLVFCFLKDAWNSHWNKLMLKTYLKLNDYAKLWIWNRLILNNADLNFSSIRW